MSRDRFVQPSVNEGLARRASRERAAGEKQYGPLLRIDFPAADAPRVVAHGLPVMPDGFEAARRTGAVYEVDWSNWDAQTAILQAPAAHTLAVGRFFVWAIPTPEAPV